MPAPRTLADAIRAMDTAGLERLFTLRPDLTHPRPATLGELAERAGNPASARLAIERLDAWQRRVATALAAVPDGESLRRLAALLQVERSDVTGAATVLRDSALAWGDDRVLHLTSGARHALGPFPAGLAPPSPAPMPDADVDAALAEGGEPVRALLYRLVWELPVGQVRDADRRGSGDSAADRALALHLLRPREAHTVILPREVSLRLRGGRLFEHAVPPQLPAWPASDDDAGVLRRTNAAGLGAAFELVRHVELVVDEVAARGMRPLASGGMAKKDAAALFSLLGSEQLGSFVARLAHAARLLASNGHEWLPTAQFDRWVSGSDWQRWQELRAAWQLLPGWPDGGSLLGPASHATGWAAQLRHAVLHQLRSAPVGTPVSVEALLDRLEWSHPGWHSELLPDLCGLALDELSRLGVLALGRRTELLDADADPGFPVHVDRFLLQGDLTAVSTGPLDRATAVSLGLLADRESVGGAGVHRFTATSIRRGLDAGWSADDVRAWIADHSDTGLPQPLAYLIDDVARRHGAVQVSAVSSVVNVDDPALVEALLADPRARSLGLRRIAAGVLGALAEPDEVVDLLRSMGHAPVARDASGAPAVAPVQRRAPSAPARGAEPPNRSELHRLAEDLRAREDPAVHARGSDDVVGVLAHHAGSPTWLEVDHVLDDGTPRTVLARVVGVSSGMVRLQPREGAATTVAVSRIVGVRVPRRLG